MQQVNDVIELCNGVSIDNNEVVSSNADINGIENVLDPLHSRNDMSPLIFYSGVSCSLGDNSTSSLFYLYINGLDFTFNEHPYENPTECCRSSDMPQNMLNPLADSFLPKANIPLSPSYNFEREDFKSGMEILSNSDPNHPMHIKYSNVNASPSDPYSRDPPMTVVESQSIPSINAPQFYSPQKLSEMLAEIPDVIEIDTPDLSLLLSSFLEKENCVAFINNYVFINGVEFGAYYFVLAMSLIVTLSVFLNPIHNANCSDIKGRQI